MREILNEYVTNLKKIYGSAIKKIILFGSHARWDFNEDSDVDIAILLDLNEVTIQRKESELSFYTYDFNALNDTDIKPVSINYSQYLKWLSVHPFYKNISLEGVILYE